EQLPCPAGGATLRLKMYPRFPMIGLPPELLKFRGSVFAKVTTVGDTRVPAATIVAMLPPVTITRSPACSPTPAALIAGKAGTGAGTGGDRVIVEPELSPHVSSLRGNG